MAHSIPAGAFRSEVSAVYNRHTISRELRHGETLPDRVWGKLIVEEGELILRLGASRQESRVTPAEPLVIPPRSWFACADTGGPVLFHIEYFHESKQNDPGALAGRLRGSSRATA